MSSFSLSPQMGYERNAAELRQKWRAQVSETVRSVTQLN